MAIKLLTQLWPPHRVTARMFTEGTPSNATANWSREMADIASRQDRAAFMRIYDYFLPRLCRYLSGMGCTESVAEDLAQETMLRLWQHAVSYDPAQSAVSTWLFRIARNLHIGRLRHEAYQPSLHEESGEKEISHEQASAESYAAHGQLQARIAALSPTQARLIRMSYFEAKSHQEIASELDMPLGTVKSHLRRAFLRLQGEMGATP